MTAAEPDLFAGQPEPRRTRSGRILHAFGSCPGLTGDECALMLQLPVTVVRPRIADLATAGKLVDTGRRRPGMSGALMTVWAIAPEPPG